MATKLVRSRALAQALRSARLSIQNPRNEAAARCFSVTARANSYTVKLPKDAKNMRLADREELGTLEAPIVNPTDQYQSKADNLHKYGSWLMGCLPKYIQQFSVWKDELTIYICPSGVIPVFSFLKCKCSLPHYLIAVWARLLLSHANTLVAPRQHRCRVHPSQLHHRRRLPHPRPAFRSRLQPVVYSTQ